MQFNQVTSEFIMDKAEELNNVILTPTEAYIVLQRMEIEYDPADTVSLDDVKKFVTSYCYDN